MIKVAVGSLLLIVFGCFVLADSQALQFQKRTLGQTDVSERISMVPVFYGYRLQAYLEQRFEAAQGWVRNISQVVRKPA